MCPVDNCVFFLFAFLFFLYKFLWNFTDRFGLTLLMSPLWWGFCGVVCWASLGDIYSASWTKQGLVVFDRREDLIVSVLLSRARHDLEDWTKQGLVVFDRREDLIVSDKCIISKGFQQLGKNEETQGYANVSNNSIRWRNIVPFWECSFQEHDTT